MKSQEESQSVENKNLNSLSGRASGLLIGIQVSRHETVACILFSYDYVKHILNKFNGT